MAKKITKITIDAGATGSGYAIWNTDWKLLASGVILPEKHIVEWEEKAYDVTRGLEEIIKAYGCSEGWIEYPAFFMSHGACGVANSGALVKLAFFVGLVCGAMPCRIHLLTVSEWKGQLPKKVVISRIKRILPNCKATSHDADAIGMGLFLKGDLK